jgi:hypothetical protein
MQSTNICFWNHENGIVCVVSGPYLSGNRYVLIGELLKRSYIWAFSVVFDGFILNTVCIENSDANFQKFQ